MKSIIAAAAIAMALSGVAASAQEAQPDAPKEKKICRSERMTGSLTRRTRTCLTEAQWRELNQRTQRGLQELQGSAAGGKECIQDGRGGC